MPDYPLVIDSAVTNSFLSTGVQDPPGQSWKGKRDHEQRYYDLSASFGLR
jgi:hypothetical protein